VAADERKRFAGKTALITGGCSGIGLASAIRMAAEGCNVALCDKNTSAFKEAKSRVEEVGGRCLTIETDVTIEKSLKASFSKTVGAFGGIDILVTSAGTGDGTKIRKLTSEKWAWVLDLNLGGTYLACRLAVEEMRRKKKGGAIITISSMGGLIAVYGGPAFAASKGGIIHFTKCLAVELAKENIRVNCVCRVSY